MKHQPRKRFGQNFLSDNRVIDRMLGHLRIAADDNLVEVGPGLGALTDPLLTRVDTLKVVEIDRDLIERLRARNKANLQIHEGDVLNIDWQDMHAGVPLRIVGNLPYNIGTPLLIVLMQSHSLITDIHVMLQKEVVDRLCAKAHTRAYGRLSVVMQSVFDIQALFNVPPSAFTPAPKVDSAVVRLTTKSATPSDHTLELLQLATRLAFANKRKTLRNNFKGHLDDQALQALDIDPQARAETLSVEAFHRLAKRLSLP